VQCLAELGSYIEHLLQCEVRLLAQGSPFWFFSGRVSREQVRNSGQAVCPSSPTIPSHGWWKAPGCLVGQTLSTRQCPQASQLRP